MEYKFKKPGKYKIELKSGKEILCTRNIQVKGFICWLETHISSWLNEFKSLFSKLGKKDYSSVFASLMVGAGLAFITSIAGLDILYIDGFGSSMDYIKALVWGSGADQVSKLTAKLNPWQKK